MVDFLYLVMSLCIITGTVSYIFFKAREMEKKSRTFSIEKSDSYLATLEYFSKKAYDMIYKDRIMIYSIEAMSINETEYKAVSKEFCSLVLKLLGPSLVKELSNFFGDDKTLMFNILELFSGYYENDKIKETATENLMGKEIEIEPSIGETR